MKRLFKIIVVLTPLLCGRVLAQEKPATSSFLKDLAHLPTVSLQTPPQNLRPALLSPQKINSLPQNYYTSNFGYFCKKELAVEKATGLPLKFRLGSLDYCNRLEGK